MDEKELKSKIINKAAEMIDNVKEVEELYKISQIYCDVTKEDWAQKVFRSLNDMQDKTKYDYALLKPQDKQLPEKEKEI